MTRAVILITRPEPGATETAARVAAMGLVPLVAPLLSIQPLGKAAQLPDDIGATLLTSRNAVAGCPASCHDLPAFTVGDATANDAVAAGFSQVTTAGGDAVALAALVSAQLSPLDGTLFLPVGRGQGCDLATSLRESGFQVIRRVVYEVLAASALPIAAESHLRHRRVNAVMFFSAATARHFVRLLCAANLDQTVVDVEAVSISERSAMALSELPWRRINVAMKPNQEAMLALLR